MPVNKQIILDSRPQGKVSPGNFRLAETPLPAAWDGWLIVRNHYVSLDPYMRGRLNESRSYARPQPLGEVMIAATVGEVIESNRSEFSVGDFVTGPGGWQDYTITDGVGWRKVDPRIPLSAYLGVVGMPGVTAWVGLKEIIKPKPGETVVVSAASGAVGGVVGQLAKLQGARVVGIAGGSEKCAYVRDELGFDACMDHRSERFEGELSASLQDGLDGLFENVGGEPFRQAFKHLNDFARIAICGLIASYEGAPTELPSLMSLLTRRVKMQGFIVGDFAELWPPALAELTDLVATGRLKYRETVRQGIEAAPQALVDLLHGGNFGKMLIKLV